MAARRGDALFTVIRCGETAWDAEGRLPGHNDLPLSTQGRSSVTHDTWALAGRRLRVVYHAPDEAAAETARIVAGVVGARRRGIADLADANLGVLAGMSGQEFAERFAKRFKQWTEDPLSLSPPEGEDVVAARARLFSAIARILRRRHGDEAAAVLHPLGLGLLRSWLAERPASDLWIMVRTRPRIERYLMPVETIAGLEHVARKGPGDRGRTVADTRASRRNR